MVDSRRGVEYSSTIPKLLRFITIETECFILAACPYCLQTCVDDDDFAGERTNHVISISAHHKLGAAKL
jgi:hypothetical protein